VGGTVVQVDQLSVRVDGTSAIAQTKGEPMFNEQNTVENHERIANPKGLFYVKVRLQAKSVYVTT
jgi:hypothetical protein